MQLKCRLTSLSKPEVASGLRACTEIGPGAVYRVVAETQRASQPATTLTAPALVPTHNFNGDGKSDILWQHDSGLLSIWTMDGTTVIGTAVLPTCCGCAGDYKCRDERRPRPRRDDR
jgi:hypothetical protein